jgi:hypothetical protein
MKHFLIIFLFFVTIISCKKKEEESCSSCPVGGGTEPTGFYFAKNSGGTIKADSAYFYPSTKTIIAYYQGMTNRVIIKTSAQAVGVYGFTTTANTCKYIEPLGIYNATNGSINITANASGKMSGNFTSGGGGVATAISGNFKDITQK